MPRGHPHCRNHEPAADRERAERGKSMQVVLFGSLEDVLSRQAADAVCMLSRIWDGRTARVAELSGEAR